MLFPKITRGPIGTVRTNFQVQSLTSKSKKGQNPQSFHGGLTLKNQAEPFKQSVKTIQQFRSELMSIDLIKSTAVWSVKAPITKSHSYC